MKKFIIVSSLLAILSHAALAETVIGTLDLTQLRPLREQWQGKRLPKINSVNTEYDQMKADIKQFQAAIHTKENKAGSTEEKARQAHIQATREKLSKDTLAMSSHMLEQRSKVEDEFNTYFEKSVAELAKQNHVNLVIPAQIFLYKEGTVDLTPAMIAKMKQELGR